MAIRTRNVASFGDPAASTGQCTWEYDYDDAALRLTALRCTNASTYPSRGTVTVEKNGRTFTRLVAAGGSLNVSIPTGPQVRLEITVDQFGRVNGLDHRFDWGPDVV